MSCDVYYILMVICARWYWLFMRDGIVFFMRDGSFYVMVLCAMVLVFMRAMVLVFMRDGIIFMRDGILCAMVLVVWERGCMGRARR